MAPVKRLRSDLVSHDDPVPTGLKVKRVKTYEANNVSTASILVKAQASSLLGQLSGLKDPYGRDIQLSKAEQETIRDDLLDIRCDAQHVEVSNATLSDPERAIRMLCSRLREEDWKRAISAYLYNPHLGLKQGPDFARLWTTFTDLEQAVSARPADEFVAPSGEFDKYMRLFVQRHYATNNCKRPDFTHSADTSNVCTNMLLEAGLNPLLYPLGWSERWYRRESTMGVSGVRERLPMAKRPVVEHEIHQSFNRDLIQLAGAKVHLLLGEASCNGFQAEYAPLEAVLSRSPLLRVWVVAREFRHVKGKTVKLVDMMAVPCMHPEAVFSGDVGRGHAIDESIRLAVELSGLKIPLNSNYFHNLELGRTRVRRFALKTGPNVNKAIVLNSMLAFENDSAEDEKIP